jgi:hypothetical protein
MTFRTCSYEKEVTRALKDGHWPAGCAPELRAHVQACKDCSDLVLVTQAFQQARNQFEREIAPASPSLLWWRAQLRRRNALAERVSRPISIAQGFALFVNGIVGAGFLAWQFRHGMSLASWRSDLTRLRTLVLPIGSLKLDWNLMLLIPSLAALVLLSGLLVYLVSEKS